MANRVDRSVDCEPSFETLFGRVPDYTAEAHGRVNLMGDHTDYSGGFVLPTVIPQRTRVEIGLRPDRTVRVWSCNIAEQPREFIIGGSRQGGQGGWIDYAQGVLHVLASDDKYQLSGCDLRVESTVPLGAGLASSAALEVSLLRVLRDAYRLPIDDVQVAMLAHRAETEFVGAPVGLMDQMVCSLGKDRQALYLDTFTLESALVPLPPDMDLIVIHSGVHHHHVTGSYRVRREECRTAAALLGVGQLRELEGAGRQMIFARLDALPAPLGRRVRHVVTENERVLRAVELLESHDLVQFGQLMYSSHDSLRDDYEASVEETDLLVQLARSDTQVYGARLTGGGFGGSVVMAAHAGTGAAVAKRIASAYEHRSGKTPSVLLPLE